MSSEIPMLSLIKKGSKLFPRYVLARADEYMNPVYWILAEQTVERYNGTSDSPTA